MVKCNGDPQFFDASTKRKEMLAYLAMAMWFEKDFQTYSMIKNDLRDAKAELQEIEGLRDGTIKVPEVFAYDAKKKVGNISENEEYVSRLENQLAAWTIVSDPKLPMKERCEAARELVTSRREWEYEGFRVYTVSDPEKELTSKRGRRK